MALYVEFNTGVRVYGDTSKTKIKGSLVVEDKVIDVLTWESSARVSLAALATDIAFNMQGGTNAKLLLLESVKEFSFKLNAGAAITLKPRTNAADQSVVPACAMLMTDAITSLSFTNPDTSSAIEVDVSICG